MTVLRLDVKFQAACSSVENIWDRIVPPCQMEIVNQMWAVCAFCCNAQPNIMSM